MFLHSWLKIVPNEIHMFFPGGIPSLLVEPGEIPIVLPGTARYISIIQIPIVPEVGIFLVDSQFVPSSIFN